MIYKRWDVVAVEYPFIEGDTAKRRPALIVSSDALHQTHDVCWAAMITTARAGVRRDDVPVTDHRAAGLPEECVIRTTRLTTLSDAQIARRIGAITSRDRNAVAALIKRFLP